MLPTGNLLEMRHHEWEIYGCESNAIQLGNKLGDRTP